MDYEKVLLKNMGYPEVRTLRGYEDRGGYKAIRKALGLEPKAIVAEVKKAQLRGRGGAGFDCGSKWSFLPPLDKRPVTYLCVNADESSRLLLPTGPSWKMTRISCWKGC